MSKNKNEISLVNARLLFAIHPNTTPHAKSHFSVEVDFTPEFHTREEYLAFRKAWKAKYKRLSKGIRMIKPVANYAWQELPGTTYYHGRYHLPHSNIGKTLFFWRMQAKALLVALAVAKKVAGEQYKQNCTHCLQPDCACTEADVVMDMGAKG